MTETGKDQLIETLNNDVIRLNNELSECKYELRSIDKMNEYNLGYAKGLWHGKDKSKPKKCSSYVNDDTIEDRIRRSHIKWYFIIIVSVITVDILTKIYLNG